MLVLHSIEGYGTIWIQKNFAHDMEAPRYKIKASDPTKLERVYPYEFTPTTIGEATNISRDYVTAPFEMSIIFLKDVYRGLVPENPTAVSGVLLVVHKPGTYKWINIEDKTPTSLVKLASCLHVSTALQNH